MQPEALISDFKQ